MPEIDLTGLPDKGIDLSGLPDKKIDPSGLPDNDIDLSGLPDKPMVKPKESEPKVEQGWLGQSMDQLNTWAKAWQSKRQGMEESIKVDTAGDIGINAIRDVGTAILIPGDIIANAVKIATSEKSLINKAGESALFAAELITAPLKAVGDLYEASAFNISPGLHEVFGDKEGAKQLRLQQLQKQREIARHPALTVMLALGAAKGIGAAAKIDTTPISAPPIDVMKKITEKVGADVRGLKNKKIVVDTVPNEMSKLQKTKRALSREPTSEAQAVILDIAREATGIKNLGHERAAAFRGALDAGVKEVVKKQPFWDRVKKQFTSRGYTKELNEDMIFYREKTGNPKIKGDTFEALSARIPEGAKKLVDLAGNHLDALHKMLNESNYLGNINYLENYLPHIYNVSSYGKNSARNVSAFLLKKFPHAKQRTIENYHQAITELGLESKFDSIGKHIQYYENLSYEVIANNFLIDNLKGMKSTDGKSIVYKRAFIPAGMEGEYVSMQSPVFRRVYAIEGKVIGAKEYSGKTKTTETSSTQTQKEFTDTKETRRETIDGGKVGGELASSGPKAKLEGVVLEALESRGFSKGEATNYLLRIKGGAAELSSDAIMKVVEVIKDKTTTKETLRTMTKETIREKIIELEREKPTAIVDDMIWVHPEVARPLRNIIDKGFDMGSGFFKWVKVANALAKKSMLSLSFFHHLALTESAAASGNWNPYLSVKRGRELIKRMDSTVDIGLRNGLKIDATNDVHLSTVNSVFDAAERWTQKIPVVGQVTRGMKAINSAWDRGLWDNYHRMLKVDAFHQIYQNNLEKYGDKYSEKQIAREAANFVNDAFGGQNWEGYLNTPKSWGQRATRAKAEQIAQLFFLAPDWTLSNLKIAGRGIGAFTGTFGPKTVRGQAKAYWIRAGLMFTAAQQMAQYGFWEMNLSPEEKKKYSPWMWENAPDEGFSINTFMRDDKGAWRMIRPLKQAREVLRMAQDVTEVIGSKLSPFAREAIEQFVGYSPGSGFKMEYADMDFWDSIPTRMKSAISKAAPMSVKGGNFAFTLPQRKAMSSYKTAKLFSKTLREFAENRDAGADVIDFLDEIRLHAEDNNIDTKQVFNMAMTGIRVEYYSDFFAALNKGDMEEVDRIAFALARLRAEPSSINESLIGKFQRTILDNSVDASKEDIKRLIKSGMMSVKAYKSEYPKLIDVTKRIHIGDRDRQKRFAEEIK